MRRKDLPPVEERLLSNNRYAPLLAVVEYRTRTKWRYLPDLLAVFRELCRHSQTGSSFSEESMSHFDVAAPAADSSLPNSTSAAPQYGPIYSAYPRMLVGFGLLAIWGAARVEALRYDADIKSSLTAAALLAGLAGYVYWMFCIHRIHKILREYTKGTYPIAPWKSVTYHFIPGYSLYWIFKWPGTLAKFVSSTSNSDGKPLRMRGWLPALALLVASVMTSLFGFEKGIGLQLLLLFGAGLYVTRKLQDLLPAPEPISLRRLKQWKVAASAGVGAAFSLLLFEAIREFFSPHTPKLEREHELVAILLVSVGVMIFLEPLAEKVRDLLVHDHLVLRTKKSWWLRLAIFGILVFTSLLHGMAHTAVDNWMKDPDGHKKIAALAAAMLISGGITYFWIGAAHLHRPHATLSGAVGGAALAVVISFGLASVVVAHGNGSGDVTNRLEEHFALPGVPLMVTHQLENGALDIKTLLFMAVPWLLMGLAGGAVIDRRWMHCCAGSLALSVVVAGIVGGLLLRFFSSGWAQTFAHLPAVAGWVVALIVCCSPRTLGLDAAPSHSVHRAHSPALASAVASS